MGHVETYHSACHALNFAVQVYDDLETACLMVEAVWNLVPPDVVPPEMVLQSMLAAAGIRARSLTGKHKTVRETLERNVRLDRLCFFLVDIEEGAHDYRWCVLMGHDRRHVHYAVMVQRGDPPALTGSTIDRACGPVLVVNRTPRNRGIVATTMARGYDSE